MFVYQLNKNYQHLFQQSEIQYIDSNGEGLYKGQLSPCAKREGHGRMEWTSETSLIKGGTYEGFWKDDKVRIFLHDRPNPC